MRFSVELEFVEMKEVSALIQRPHLASCQHVSCTAPFNEMDARIVAALERLEQTLRAIATERIPS